MRCAHGTASPAEAVAALGALRQVMSTWEGNVGAGGGTLLPQRRMPRRSILTVQRVP
jgi:hypothetical protein